MIHINKYGILSIRDEEYDKEILEETIYPVGE